MAESEIMNYVLTSGSLDIGFYIGVVLIIIGLIGWGVWWMIKKRAIYVFNFRIIDTTGSLVKKKARIIRAHNGVKKFEIEGYNQLLDIKDPNAIVDGQPTRVVAWDGMGNLAYTDKIDYENLNSNHKFKVATNKYLETALIPVEREQTANAIIDSVKKHGSTPPGMKMIMWFMVAIVIAIVIGMFVQGRLLSEQYKQETIRIQTAHETAVALENTANIIAENTEIQKIVLYHVLNLTGKPYNITFEAVAK